MKRPYGSRRLKPAIGYCFAYAAWVRSSAMRSEWASEGYHYYIAFEALQP